MFVCLLSCLVFTMTFSSFSSSHLSFVLVRRFFFFCVYIIFWRVGIRITALVFGEGEMGHRVFRMTPQNGIAGKLGTGTGSRSGFDFGPFLFFSTWRTHTCRTTRGPGISLENLSSCMQDYKNAIFLESISRHGIIVSYMRQSLRLTSALEISCSTFVRLQISRPYRNADLGRLYSFFRQAIAIAYPPPNALRSKHTEHHNRQSNNPNRTHRSSKSCISTRFIATRR